MKGLSIDYVSSPFFIRTSHPPHHSYVDALCIECQFTSQRFSVCGTIIVQRAHHPSTHTQKLCSGNSTHPHRKILAIAEYISVQMSFRQNCPIKNRPNPLCSTLQKAHIGYAHRVCTRVLRRGRACVFKLLSLNGKSWSWE